ncbi:MAG TPA: Rieske 2Fe-2S domain-containing protein [Nitrososphaeraceae archaeon]|nr:Rieske 2Fe-2S domain-containing protein [Nitrososphaeraceae archaeon]
MKKNLKDSKNIDSFQFVCLASDVKEGEPKVFSLCINEKKKIEILIFNFNDNFYAISSKCIHKGGPLVKGKLDGHIITCPWHGWKYDIRTGLSSHEGGSSVDNFNIKISDNKIYVNPVPKRRGKITFVPHPKYLQLAHSVQDRLTKLDRHSTSSQSYSKLKILGISTTNKNDKVVDRKSTSDEALYFAIQYAKNQLNAETIFLKLRDLEFRHCEGYYSTDAKACIFPCSISESDENDEMIEIYSKILLWSDVVIIATPIRWGSASSLYYKMIERMNCVQNQSITNNNYLVRDKVAAFIITGGQDNIQHVAGEMLSFWSQLGFIFGKFPFVGWSRGWYAEDTQNNYEQLNQNLDKNYKKVNNYEEKSVQNVEKVLGKDIVRTILASVYMAKLIRNNKYDESIIKNIDNYDHT